MSSASHVVTVDKMSRSVQRFRKTEVTRAIKAAMDAGADNFRVEISPDGRINVIVGKAAADENEWDELHGEASP